MPWSTPMVLVGCGLGVGLLHVVLARWRDLGPLTMGLLGAAVVLQQPPEPLVLDGVVLAMVLSSVAWARGGARGVGRPALTGLVIAASIAASAGTYRLVDQVPVPEERLRWAAASVLGLVTVALSTMALMRARPGYPPPRWTGEIPVRGPSDA